MRHFALLIISISLCTMLATSCVADSKAKLATEDILGTWNLEQAFRGGKQTQTLDSVYFVFAENGQAKTNFTLDGEEQTFTYEIKGGQIELKGGKDLNINAVKTEKGLLELTTKFVNFDFKLILAPQSNTEQSQDD